MSSERFYFATLCRISVSVISIALLVIVSIAPQARSQEIEETGEPQSAEQVQSEIQDNLRVEDNGIIQDRDELQSLPGEVAESTSVMPDSIEDADNPDEENKADEEPLFKRAPLNPEEFNFEGNLDWQFRCDRDWAFKITPASSLPTDVDVVDRIEVRLPLANRHRMPEISSVSARSVSPDGVQGHYDVSVTRRDGGGYETLQFQFEPPIPVIHFGGQSPVNIAFKATVRWSGATTCNKQNWVAKNDIMPGAKTSIYVRTVSEQEGLLPQNTELTGPKAKIRVKVSGLRGPNGVSTLPGAKLQLHHADNPAVTRDPYWRNRKPAHDQHWGTPGTAIDEDWAQCTVSRDGYCTFEVPAPTKGDKTPGAIYWVAPKEAPEGYNVIDQLRVGFSGGNSGGGRGNAHALDYAYRTPPIFAGETITSGDGNSETGFMTFKRENQYTTLKEEGVPYPRASSGQVVFRRDNPLLPDKCGINVGIVLDTSGSMGGFPFGRKTSEVARQGIYDFVGNLRNSGVNVGFTTFSTSAGTSNGRNQIVSPIAMDDAGVNRIQRIVGSPRDRIRGSLSFDGATNWDDALRVIGDHNVTKPREAYDLVIVVTDGNPTRTAVAGQQGPGNAGDFSIMENTVLRSNWLKETGGKTRVVGVGVGTFQAGGIVGGAVDTTLSERNFNAVFGPNGTTNPISGPADLAQKDWMVFDGSNEEFLAQALSEVALAGCEASVIVEKEIQVLGQEIEKGGEGWSFEASGLARGFGFADAPGSPTVKKKTDANSKAEFRLTLDTPASAGGTLTITENLAEGPRPSEPWEISRRGTPARNAVCVDHSKNGSPNIDVIDQGTYGFRVSGITNSSRIHCKVLNVKQGDLFVSVQKVDANDKASLLDSAKFSVFPSANEGTIDFNRSMAFTDGRFKVEQGLFALVETKSPQGYSLLAQPVYFEVALENGQQRIYLLERSESNLLQRASTSTLALAELIDSATGNPAATQSVVADATGTFHLRIADVATGSLPKTGSGGLYPYLALAISILLAGLGLMRKYGAV